MKFFFVWSSFSEQRGSFKSNILLASQARLAAIFACITGSHREALRKSWWNVKIPCRAYILYFLSQLYSELLLDNLLDNVCQQEGAELNIPKPQSLDQMRRPWNVKKCLQFIGSPQLYEEFVFQLSPSCFSITVQCIIHSPSSSKWEKESVP